MPRRADEVLSAYKTRRGPLLDALAKPGAELIEKPLLKAILVTDVCVASYAALGEALDDAMKRSNQSLRSLTDIITKDTNSLNQSAEEAVKAGPIAFEMSKGVSAYKALTYETFMRASFFESDFLKFVDLVADETALAVLSPPEPRLSTAILAVAWDKLIDEVVDAASLWVISVIKKMREQLPDPSAATSYLSQLDGYTKSGEKAVTLIECLRQIILDQMSDKPSVKLDYEALASRAGTVIKERSEAIAGRWR